MRFKISEMSYSRVIYGIVRRLKDTSNAIAWECSGFSKINSRRIEKYRNINDGKRCFILANGPSLGLMNLANLKGEYTISMNRAYLLYNQWGFIPTYFVSINDLVINQFADDIKNLKIPRFLNYSCRQKFNEKFADESILYLRIGLNLIDKFSNDFTKSISSGGTVTFVCLQLAYFLGFKEVIILGLDHNFVEKGIPNTTVIRTQNIDQSHCHPDYFPKGVLWQLPDLNRSEIAYKLARKMFEKNGRKIFDATINGKCNIFTKIDFDSLF